MPALASSHLPSPISRPHLYPMLGLFARLTLRALVNPAVALDLLRVGWRYRRRRWWAQAPFIPWPDRAYLRWRMYTAYGDEDAIPPVADVLRYARWTRHHP